MSFDIEIDLVRELHQVAEGVEVPAMPPLPSESDPRPRWQPLLVAAAVVLIVLGAVAGVLALGGDDDAIEPAPSPSPTVATDGATEDPTEPEAVSTTPPSVPYVVGNRLYVAGNQVAGNDWAWVTGTNTGWVAGGFDGGESTYSWGYDATPQRIEGFMHQPPAVSPGGGYWAAILDQGNEGLLTGADTVAGGEGLGGTPIEVLNRGVYTSVAAVTDEGLVITGGTGDQILWRPLVDGETVALADTARTRWFSGTPRRGCSWWTRPAPTSTGGGTATSTSPTSPTRARSPGSVRCRTTTPWPPAAPGSPGSRSASWAASSAGSPSSRSSASTAATRGTLTPPEGWLFRPGAGTWEDDDHLIAAVVQDGGEAERMVRCSPDAEECVLLDRP